MRCFAAAAMAAVMLSPAFAVAQEPSCGPYPDVLRALGQNFGEVPVATGVDSRGHAIVVLASPDGGTWTILIRNTAGIACMAASGENWRPAAPTVPGQGA